MTASPRVFEHRSIIPATIEQVWAFHEHPKALDWLTPPPIFVRIHHNGRTSLTAGEVEFTLHFALLPVRWIARHEPGPTPTSFVDRMIRGPVESWVHTHTLKPVSGGVELTDHIEIVHKRRGFWALFSRLFFGALPLRMLFTYRHLRTRRGAPRINPISVSSPNPHQEANKVYGDKAGDKG